MDSANAGLINITNAATGFAGSSMRILLAQYDEIVVLGMSPKDLNPQLQGIASQRGENWRMLALQAPFRADT